MRTLVVAPHADDEVLGCGGTLLRKAENAETIGWLLMTSIDNLDSYDSQQKTKRKTEVEEVKNRLRIADCDMYTLDLPSTKLDTIPKAEMIRLVGRVIKTFQPEEIFIPHPNDAHSDHRICFDVVSACTKWFRYTSIKRVLTYEVLSETDASLGQGKVFEPNLFVDIGKQLEKKWELLSIYASEVAEFPFPRSKKAVFAQAHLRGAQSGFEAAEAFCILRDRMP